MNSASLCQANLSSEKLCRIAMVVSHPIQYLAPMYQKIASDGRVELRVIFAEGGAEARFDRGFGTMVKWQDNILDGYDSRVVRVPSSQRSRAVVDELRKFAPDVVHLNGYHIPYLRAALRWSRSSGVATMLTTDNELLRPRPIHLRAIKRIILPPIFRKIDQFLTMGDENGRYYEHYGATPDRFYRLSWPIDSDYYDRLLVKRDEIRRTVRRELNLEPETVAILCVGKLIPRKAQADLIRALLEVRRTGHHSAVLLLAGDGQERSRLEQLAQEAGSAVRFLGFIGIDDLPRYYISADLYAHPASHDPHPVAISEALYCSLPIIVSDRVGSAGPTDDVQIGRNGWVYPVGDAAKLANILSELIEQPAIRMRAGQISRKLGELHASSYCAQRLIEGAQRALAVRKQNET